MKGTGKILSFPFKPQHWDLLQGGSGCHHPYTVEPARTWGNHHWLDWVPRISPQSQLGRGLHGVAKAGLVSDRASSGAGQAGTWEVDGLLR